MIRTHIFPCSLPKAEADALNHESGRLYTQTLVWHYRIFRRKGVWLSRGAAEKLGDSLSDTTLHAHSRDAAQQGFYKACKTTRANRDAGAKYPYKRKFYRTTIWKNTGIRLNDGVLLLARARGLAPVAVSLPNTLSNLPQKAFLEARLVYDQVSRRYQWHVVVEDGVLPNDPPGEATLAVDLGEIHPAAVANERGETVIFTARELRSLNQYRNKRLAELRRKQDAKVKGSRAWKRLQRRKNRFLAKNERQRRDIEHKVTRAITNHAVEEGASRVVVGDIRDIADGKRLNAKAQQKVSNWSHGRQVQYLTYKLAAEGIALERESEAYTSKTCPKCGAINKPRSRNYRCSSCGFECHRDANGACNLLSRVLFGEFGHIVPSSLKYRRPFEKRGRSRLDTAQVAGADRHGS